VNEVETSCTGEGVFRKPKRSRAGDASVPDDEIRRILFAELGGRPRQPFPLVDPGGDPGGNKLDTGFAGPSDLRRARIYYDTGNIEAGIGKCAAELAIERAETALPGRPLRCRSPATRNRPVVAASRGVALAKLRKHRWPVLRTYTRAVKPERLAAELENVKRRIPLAKGRDASVPFVRAHPLDAARKMWAPDRYIVAARPGRAPSIMSRSATNAASQ